MMQIFASELTGVGFRISDARTHWQLIRGDHPKEDIEKWNEWLRNDIKAILKICEKLSLDTSAELLSPRIKELPTSKGEFDVLMEAVEAELRHRLFLYVPRHLSRYYESDRLTTEKIQNHFPIASKEMKTSGTCLAAGLNTACVFHAMRAAELGLRSFGQSLNITLSKPIEDASWEDILGAMKSRVEAIEKLPNSTPNKKDDLEFYSLGAAQFRFFKNGWRTRAAHPKDAVFEEGDARKALNDVRDYFRILVPRLREL